MQEDLISFETAKLAKEKGFNIPTLYGCNEKGELQEYFTYESYSPGEPEVRITDFIKEWEYQLPTQSLLQKWLREVHNIHLMIKPWDGDKFQIFVLYDDPSKEYNEEYNEEECFDTYEKALEIGVQEALKLINN